MFFESILKALHQKRIEFLVIGGVAVNLHGFQRATADLDLLLSLDEDNVALFISLMKAKGWKPRIPAKLDDLADKEKRETWIKRKGMKAFSLYNPKNQIEQMDILIESPLSFSSAYKRKKVFKAGALLIPVASIPDLIKLKKSANRSRDRIDIEALENIRKIIDGKKKKKK